MAGASLSSTLSPERLEFVHELFEAGERAAEAVGGFEDHFFSVAGTTIRMRFAGLALVEPLGATFAHLEVVPTDEPNLTAVLWDSESTGVAAPSPPWEIKRFQAQGKIEGLFGDGIYATFHMWARSLSVLDVDNARFLNWRGSADDVPWFESGTPFHSVLHLWFSAQGIQLVHAGAVGSNEGCVLLAGKAGAGKSSTALAPLATDSWLGLLGDDYCLIGPEAGPPTAYNLYGSAKATTETLGRLPRLSELVSNPHRSAEDKGLLDIAGREPERLLKEAPIQAILVIRVTGRSETTIENAPPAGALAALAPSTILQLPGADEETMRRMAEITTRTPCYYLNAGTDPARLVAAIEELLSR